MKHMDQAGIAVVTYIRIPQVVPSNLGRNTGYLVQGFHGFLSQSRKIPLQYLHYVTIVSFHIVYILSHMIYPIIQRYIMLSMTSS
jgi:hypothetical protein